MMKRLSLLLAALFVASMVLVAPVFASGNGDDDNGNANHNGKVCHYVLATLPQ
jgi:predicted small secreted protein